MKIVRKVLSGKSIEEASIENNVDIASTFKWVQIYRQRGIDGLNFGKEWIEPMPTLKKELKEKIKANNKHRKFTVEKLEYIFAEIAYLKKLQALVQEENQKQK